MSHTSNELRRCELTLDGRSSPLTGDYTLMFRQRPGMPPEPVLYFRGIRVIRAWSLSITHSEPSDPFGISGGREITPEENIEVKIPGSTGTNS
jgi:hypothetical protein